MPNAPSKDEKEAGTEAVTNNKENKTASASLDQSNRKELDKMVKNMYYQKGYASNPNHSTGSSSNH